MNFDYQVNLGPMGRFISSENDGDGYDSDDYNNNGGDGSDNNNNNNGDGSDNNNGDGSDNNNGGSDNNNGGDGEKRAGFEDGKAGGGEAAGGGGERAVSATEIAGGGTGGIVQGPGGDEAGAVGGQRFAEGGGNLSGGAPDVPDAHLARIAGEGGIVRTAVGEISDADAERDGGRGERSAGGGAGGDDRAVNEEAGGGAVFQDGGDVRPRAEGKIGGRDKFAVTAGDAGGGEEGEFGAVAIELEGEADEGIGAAGGEALAHEPGVGSVAGQVEPALEGERCAGGEVGGGQ